MKLQKEGDTQAKNSCKRIIHAISMKNFVLINLLYKHQIHHLGRKVL